MEIYTFSADTGKLNYWNDHINYAPPPAYQYLSREMFQKVREFESLNFPQPIVLKCRHVPFKKLDKHDWLKSDFCLPIISRRLLWVLEELGKQTLPVMPVNIVDDSNHEIYCGEQFNSALPCNQEYVALYLKQTLDCIDRESSPFVTSSSKNQKDKEYFDPRRARFLDEVDYPPIFKIRDISTPFKHFSTSVMKNLIQDADIKGVQFVHVKKAFR